MSVLLAGLVVTAQLLPGLWAATHVSRILRLGSSGFVMLVPLAGLALLSTTTLIAGHVALLGPWLVWSLAVAGIALVAWHRPQISSALAQARIDGLTQWRRAPISVTAVAFGLVLACVATFAPPSRTDEVEYHWAAPVEWAAEGRWIQSSYRHVDSFPLMEIGYTAAATVDSFAGAHLMHLSTLVALGAAAGLAARAVGVKASGAVAAAAMAMPVVWDQAYVAYNDTAVGAFTLAAAAIALLPGHRGRLALVCALLLVAISIKPTAAGAVGLVGLIYLIAEMRRGEGVAESLRRVVRIWAPLVATAIAALSFWTVRRFLMTGTWIDPSLTTPPSADELTRLPTATDQLLAPVMPFVLGLMGSQEPWGGRISLVLQLLLIPALAYAVWARGRTLATLALTALPAWVHWVVVGLVGVRTRFHQASWALLVVGVRSVVETAEERFPWLRPWVAAAWGGAVVLGVVDVSFEMVRAIATIRS